MGAAASCGDVAGTVGGAGNAYKVYEQKIIDNGVDGTLIAACDVSTILDDLGVSNATHRKKIEMMACATAATPSSATTTTPARLSTSDIRKKLETLATGGPVLPAIVVTTPGGGPPPTKDAKVEAPSLLVGAAAAETPASATPTTATTATTATTPTTATTDVFISHAPNAYSTSSGATEDRAAWIAGKIRTVCVIICDKIRVWVYYRLQLQPYQRAIVTAPTHPPTPPHLLTDMLEARGWTTFFARTDLSPVTEAALRRAVENSRVVVTVLDPVTLSSPWVRKENMWAFNSGVPISKFVIEHNRIGCACFLSS